MTIETMNVAVASGNLAEHPEATPGSRVLLLVPGDAVSPQCGDLAGSVPDKQAGRRAPKEFRLPPEKFKSEMGNAGYKLAAQHDCLPLQQFLVFELAVQASR